MQPPLNIFISHASDMLTDCKPHGDGLIADCFIRNLAARGHTIHVAVNRCELRKPYSSNVTLHPIKTGSKSDGLVSRIRFAFGARFALTRLSKKRAFDVIHQLNPVVAGLSLALWGTRPPIVLGPYVPAWPLRLHGGELRKPSFMQRLKDRVRTEIWQLQNRNASAIILSTPAALDKFRNPSAMAEKLHTIPYGIDTATFSPGPLPAGKSILFVGHLMHHKGIFVLLDAFRLVLQKISDCKLMLAGSGSEMEAVKRIVSSMENPSSVVFLGRVEREQLPGVMRDCTVVCIPSFGEPFGLVAVEAMSCGRPVVGTEASGLGHLITEQGGRKVPVGQAQALAESLTEVLENPDLARSMGEHNRRLAESEYAWPSVLAQLEQAYHSAIQLHRGGPR